MKTDEISFKLYRGVKKYEYAFVKRLVFNFGLHFLIIVILWLFKREFFFKRGLFK